MKIYRKSNAPAGTGAGRPRRTFMILLCAALCLFLVLPTLAMAETGDTEMPEVAAGTEAADPSYTIDDDATVTDGTDPAAAVWGEDIGNAGSIELILKYIDKSTNKEVLLNSGALSIYNVTDLRDWTKFTSAQLDDQNATLASSLLSNELKGKDPLDEKTIASGKVKFENLPRGMYLICQSKLSDGERKIMPFLMSIPDKKGEINISAAPKTGIEGTKDKDKEKEKETTKKKDKLPQTGMLMWPALMLVAGGLLLVLIGTWLRRQQKGPRGKARS